MQPRSGIGHYTASLAQALVDQRVNVVLMAVSATGRIGELPPGAAHRRLPVPARLMWPLWNALGGPAVEWFCGAVDVVHGPNYLLPPSRAPGILTVHDLAFVRYPDTLPAPLLGRLRRSLPRALERASCVIVPSDFTRDELINWSKIEPAKVKTIALGVRDVFLHPPDAANVLEMFRIASPFILWAGAQEPRKNLVRLMQAFRIVARNVPELSLVMCGPRGWGQKLDMESARGEIHPRIKAIGYIDDAQLASLMSACACFAFPSIYEGFGLSALEAMATGAQVVAARAGALPEILSGRAILADPFSVDDIASALQRAIEPDVAGSFDRRQFASGYTWSATARKTIQVYENAQNRGQE